jgi:uncharacterized Zn finger protein
MKKLIETDIQHWTGAASFGRGRSYFRRGRISHPRRQGNTLKADCQGSRAQPYRVEIILGPDGIDGGNCSCPVGSGGRCKHAAALLLTWLNEPGVFIEVSDRETKLAQLGKEELITLIGKMLDRYPDLEMLLELPVPTPADARAPLDTETIRRQVQHAFHNVAGEWGAAYDVSVDLLELVDIGDGYVQQQNWRDAVTVYGTVIRGTLDNYGLVEDHDGHLHQVVNRAVSGLGECLGASTEPAQRETILRALFDTYRWDVDYGGIDMGYEAMDIVLHHATDAERQTLIRWIEAALPNGDSWSAGFHRQIYGGLLLDLQEESLDDEAYLALCRQTGQLNDLVTRLLALNRLDEAVAEAKQAEDYPLLNLAGIFVEHNHGDLIETVIRERLPTTSDSRLVEWLKKQLVERGDPTAAVPLEEQLFWQRPSPSAYRQLKELAQKAGRWETLRDEVLTCLTEQRDYTLLTQIHLLENEVEQALQTLPLSRGFGSGWGYAYGGDTLAIQVAKAAEASHPGQAIDLYVKRINHLIEVRGRDNYALAAKYLLRVRELYHRLGEEATWEKLIATILVKPLNCLVLFKVNRWLRIR